MTQPVRIEHDLLGDRALPADACYGVHTLRALENFSITGTPISHYPGLISALACVKQAAALANRELGLLDEKRAQAIGLACEEICAGTSTNMNANEVICNRALHFGIQRLLVEMAALRRSFEAKAGEFDSVLKVGAPSSRTPCR